MDTAEFARVEKERRRRRTARSRRRARKVGDNLIAAVYDANDIREGRGAEIVIDWKVTLVRADGSSRVVSERLVVS